MAEAEARQPNAYRKKIFYRLVAVDACGSVSGFSLPVWYKKNDEGEYKRIVYDRKTTWEEVTRNQCQSSTGEVAYGKMDPKTKAFFDIM